MEGIAATGALGGMGLLSGPAWGQKAVNHFATLRGTEFDLTIGETRTTFTGKPCLATTVNGSIPAPTLFWREGDVVTLKVTNRLAKNSSIHWHGILVPNAMDGVPGLTFGGIEPGATYVYRFPVRQSGTYWYHSHSGFQEQTGLYGSIVIEPARGERHASDRDYVVMLSDWTDENPQRVFDKLKKMSDFYNFNQPTAVDFARDVSILGLPAAVEKRRMWNRMRMNPTDLSDVTGYTFTYLLNGTTPAGNWTGLFKPGEKIRLRVINGSATTIFDLRIPGLKMTVIAADGQDVEPVVVDEMRISVAETYDVLVEPQDDRPYTLFAQSIDRTGFARGTLSPRSGMQGDVPRVDAPQWLTMTDMMGAMADMDGMPDMAGMNMSGNDQSGAMNGMAMASMPKVHHARSEYGPGNDMRVDMPRTNLDDPGLNLRGNGRRVLTYADLHTIGGPLDPRKPSREIELHLTGNMRSFIWSFDGQKFSDAKPIHLRHGERVRVVLVNDTMMTHPIHLHGMWSEMESPVGVFQARKHTVNVQPAQRITFLVNADAVGRWAFHCHLLYHMEAGMFREVIVS